jgi:hypothetical protein
MTKHFYAEQTPRGFANEVQTYRFATKAGRDKFVANHCNDGDCNSATTGARAINAKQALANVKYTGDATTKSYNSGYIDM